MTSIPVDRQGASAKVFDSRGTGIGVFVVVITVRFAGAHFLVVA